MRRLLPPVTNLEDYRPLFNRREVWLPAIRSICDRHGLPHPDDEQPEPGSCILFRCGERRVVKLFPPIFQRDWFSERSALNALIKLRKVQIPQILDQGSLEDWPYLILSWMDGEPLDRLLPYLTPEEKRAIARQTGEGLAEIHQQACAGLAAYPPSWEDFFEQQLKTLVQRNAAAGAGQRWLDELDQLARSFPAFPRLGDAPCPIHADLNAEHIFCSREGDGWKVSGFIDFGDAICGQPEYDLVCPSLIFTGLPDCASALLDGMGILPSRRTPELFRRLTGFYFIHRFYDASLLTRFFPQNPPSNLAELSRLLWPTEGNPHE